MKKSEQHIDNEFLSEEMLLKYRQGILSASEMRRVEGLLEKYPLYAEALEGLELVSENKAKESISFLRQYAQKQAPTPARIVPLHRTPLMRVAAAVALLFVVSFGIYFTINTNSESMQMKESASSVTVPHAEEQKASEKYQDETDLTTQAEASDKQELIAENQPINKDLNATKPKQEALLDRERAQNNKPSGVADTIQTLALKTTEGNASEKINVTAEEAIIVKKPTTEDEKQTPVDITPALIESPTTSSDDKKKSSELREEVTKNADKDQNMDDSPKNDLAKKETKKARLKERTSGKEIAREQAISSSTTAIDTNEALKATLRQQIQVLAKAKNEIPKGKFVAKVTFTKYGKIDKVSIQEMPCQSCKTKPLIQTIEKHQFTNTTEQLVELVF